MIYKIAGCFAKDTPILRWNGTVVFSQDIVVGDKLVGDNETVRNVLSITNGIDELFKIEERKQVRRLQMEIIKKKKETHPSLSNIMNLKNVKVTTVKMRSKDNCMIELLYWHSPVSKRKVICKNLNEFANIRTSIEINKKLRSQYKGKANA
jgi:hypothetical protein